MKYYVSVNGQSNGDGSSNHPFVKISDAANVAKPGDEVIVAPGVYREYVNPARGGLGEDSRITYRSQEPHQAIITGAEIISDWQQAGGQVWTTLIPNTLFGSYNPFTTEIFGDWFRDLGRIHHTGQVYFNGKGMYEVGSLDALRQPEAFADSLYPQESLYQWYTEQDGDSTRLYANFNGENPLENSIEVSVRRNVFFPSQTGLNYITVSGFTLCQAATQWAPPTAFQDGLIGPHWSKGWIIEDCVISESKCSGISLGKYAHEKDNLWSKDKIKSGTQRQSDVVLYAQHTGWSKEIVGSHIVRKNRIFNCGQTGIVGHLGSIFCLVEDNEIYNINVTGEFSGSELGGIKFHAPIDTLIRRNHIHHCHRGIWLDWQVQGTRLTQNIFHDNNGIEDTRKSEDIYIEVTHGPVLVDNNLFLSKFPIRERAQGMAFVHNLIAGPIDTNGGMGRFTPYHFPHDTDVMGYMTMLNGDDRYYNNIFIQQELTEEDKKIILPELAVQMDMSAEANIEAGLHIYDEFPVDAEYYYMFTDEGTPNTSWGRQYDYNAYLPMYVDGNAYFNGAKPYCKEKTNLVDKTNKIYVRIDKKEDRYYLDTNLYEHLSKIDTPLVSSEMMGKAFEPEQRFENPDGSDLLIDKDFFGHKRAQHPTPGPFEGTPDLSKPLY